jgi:transcriptional regulator with XRE-family HTH domain
MSIGSRIREARRAAKLTQKELAQKVGMAQASLSELETGESQSTTMVGSFAAALGVNALWLETGKGAMVSADGAEERPTGSPLHATALGDIEPQKLVEQAEDEVWRKISEIVDTYRSASPTDRERIDFVIHEIRGGLVNKPKSRTR